MCCGRQGAACQPEGSGPCFHIPRLGRRGGAVPLGQQGHLCVQGGSATKMLEKL